VSSLQQRPRTRIPRAFRQAYEWLEKLLGSMGRPSVFGKTGVSSATRRGWISRRSSAVSGKSRPVRRAAVLPGGSLPHVS
jgi:hypothetical protein